MPGDMVKVISGPFSEFEGVVQKRPMTATSW
jgi:transcription antitermination factor NusG